MKSSGNRTATESNVCKSSYKHDTAFEYAQAEKKATWYLGRIKALAQEPNTLKRLHVDFNDFWKEQSKGAFISNQRRRKLMQSVEGGEIGTWNFLQKLNARKELDSYLTKTISYLYLRDLGMDLSQSAARQKVESTVSSIIKKVEKSQSANTSSDEKDEIFLQPWIAKKQYQPAYYWLMLRLSALKHQLDDQLENQDGLRKLVKVVAGIMMHHFVVRPTSQSTKQAKQESPEDIMTIVQLGYAYGLTYPFVDDLLDADSFLSDADKTVFTECLRQTLSTGKVADYPHFENDSKHLSFVYEELKWAFEFIQETLPEKQKRAFFLRASVFFESQSIDRERALDKANDYSLNDLLISVILKSSSSRLISRDLVTDVKDHNFDYRTFCFGIYNQFNDDIKDIDEDIAANNVTPYTWFLTVRKSNQNVENPYSYYWAVLYFLVYEVYKDNTYIKYLFFERTVNAHKSVLQSRGLNGYKRLRVDLLHTTNKAFDEAFTQHVIEDKQDVWFDKLVSKEVSHWMQTRREQSASFKSAYSAIKDEINTQLHINPQSRFHHGKLHEVANYAVGAGGKRIRGVIATTLGRDLYGFDKPQREAVNQLLEYMHSASLIFDDLPSQDNASMRRGVPSTHTQFKSVAKAELGAVFLMMKAIEVQSSIDCHPPKAVLASIKYAANVTQAICEGQWLDIETSGQPLSSSSLEKICHFKTGLAIEAALVIPAILAQRDELHIKQLKNLAKHIGMAFQIRDDLLDISGDTDITGKSKGLDEKLSRMNFVSVQGEYQAIEKMFEHYHSAKVIVAEMPAVNDFFNELLDFIIYRDK